MYVRAYIHVCVYNLRYPHPLYGHVSGILFRRELVHFVDIRLRFREKKINILATILSELRAELCLCSSLTVQTVSAPHVEGDMA